MLQALGRLTLIKVKSGDTSASHDSVGSAAWLREEEVALRAGVKIISALDGRNMQKIGEQGIPRRQRVRSKYSHRNILLNPHLHRDAEAFIKRSIAISGQDCIRTTHDLLRGRGQPQINLIDSASQFLLGRLSV